jgi:hypothetical protein
METQVSKLLNIGTYWQRPILELKKEKKNKRDQRSSGSDKKVRNESLKC